MKRHYEGSVKTVYQDTSDPSVSYFEFTDDYSIFDWGKMPDTIQSKGKALALMGGWFFQALSTPEKWQQLAQSETLMTFDPDFLERLFRTNTAQALQNCGLNHHFMGWSDNEGQALTLNEIQAKGISPWMKVQTVTVVHPTPAVIDRQTVYVYDEVLSALRQPAKPVLIPLEVVFRFGMPEGSSLKKRLAQNPQYYAQLGLSESPRENNLFERPVVECFTKLEPSDRFLSLQEALTLSGLNREQFQSMVDLTMLLALWLYDRFSHLGITLWDGKFEFAIGPDGLMLVDSIGPDELRLTRHGVHLSKEMIRQFYRGSAWESALNKAKMLASGHPGASWKTICLEQFQESPQPLSAHQKRWVDSLYGSLANEVMDQPVIETEWPLETLVHQICQKPVEVGG